MGFQVLTNFTSLKFSKSGQEIIDQSKKQIATLSTRVETRQARIGTICKELNLSVVDILANLEHFNEDRYGSRSSSYAGGANNALVGAVAGGGAEAEKVGTIYIQAARREELSTEASLMQEEKLGVKTLEKIVQNLRANAEFTLSYQELEFFGF